MPKTARIKQKEAFHKRMRGVKQLATEYLAPITKVGGALVSAAKGEPLDITDTEVIEGVLSGLIGGAPGGLPAGAVGTGITRSEALKQLGKSAVKLRPKEWQMKGFSGLFRSPKGTSIPAKNVREMAASIRRTPAEILEPSTSIKYADVAALGEKTRGQMVGSRGSRASKIKLAARAKPETLLHEGVHTTARATRGQKTLQGYLSDLLETSSTIGRVLARKSIEKTGKKKRLYRDLPIEKHARLVSSELGSIPGKIAKKDYDEVFNVAAQDVMFDVKKKAPLLYKETLKRVAKRYKTE